MAIRITVATDTWRSLFMMLTLSCRPRLRNGLMDRFFLFFEKGIVILLGVLSELGLHMVDMTIKSLAVLLSSILGSWQVLGERLMVKQKARLELVAV
jgi:hypothetical protein